MVSFYNWRALHVRQGMPKSFGVSTPPGRSEPCATCRLNDKLYKAMTLLPLPMRPSRKPRLILIFFIGLCGLFVYSYTMRLIEKSQVETEIVRLQARIDTAKSEQYKLLAEREALSQPDYLDRVARETFDWARPGDRVLMMIKEPALASGSAQLPEVTRVTPAADLQNLPIWQQWVSFFTSESFAVRIP
jgi:cell division protein FtsB